MDLAQYIHSFREELEENVSEELIQMGRVFSSWAVKEVQAPELSKQKYHKNQKY